MDIQYPTILRRYLATFIDGILILFLFILISSLLQSESKTITITRVGIVLILFFIYEPFCTSKLCTIGQKVTGIRVRKLNNIEKISIFYAYIRIFVKIFLGIISFLTIPISKDRRAIHDFAVGSVVIRV